MHYTVPTGYTVNETGFVYGTKSSQFNANNGGSADNLVISNDYVYQNKSSQTTAEGIYTFNGTVSKPTSTLYIKAYIIYTDENGTQHTEYSDMSSFSYNSLNTAN